MDDDDDETSNASFSSEDSQEPYYHVVTGKILPAREAWGILAAEGHPRYSNRGAAEAVLRTPRDEATTTREYSAGALDLEPLTTPPPPALSEEDSDADIHQTSSFFSAPTQSSIDKALHPESPNYISPNKDLKYQKSTSYDGGGVGAADVPPSDDEDELEDPVILRAKAMALAAQNGQKLTPEQMQLIARPDVQQQKLIEEAKRVQKAKDAAKSKEMQAQLLQQLSLPVDNLQQIGADFKKFIQTEKEKGAAPLQWGADLGKFIETRMHGGEDGGGAVGSREGGAKEESGDDKEDDAGSKQGSLPSSAVSSPKAKKKMEGFGTDPLAPRPSPVRGPPPDPSSTEGAPAASVKGSLWPVMPPLPLLNESITNMLPGGAGVSKEEGASDDAAKDPAVRISGVLWKRRSGFGKHSTLKAWERRRVELRGSKLIYYRTEGEKEEEDLAAVAAAATDGGDSADNASNGSTPRDPLGEVADASSRRASVGEVASNNSNNSYPSDRTAALLSSKSLSIFGVAAQAAEQRLQTAQSTLKSLAATATGLETFRPSSADTPRGTLDLLAEHASVSVSMGHSGAPTPFCLSIKVKGETKWKFCYDGHAVLMEWMAALADVLVEASVGVAEATSARSEGSSIGGWEMEDYCIRQRGGTEEERDSESDAIGSSAASFAMEVVDAAEAAVVSGAGREMQQWMILGTNLYVAWALFNIALIIARSSSTSIDRYWTLVVFANVGIWQLCAHSGASSLSRANERVNATIAGSREKANLRPTALSESTAITPVKKNTFKPIAGNTTIKVTKVEDSNVNENGDRLPSWVPISSSVFQVRSHGYLTTKKKIPSPGVLYECVAVDCFVSDSRFPEIAPRVRLPEIKFDADEPTNGSGKTWKSPDMFIVSIALPYEAPRFGQSTVDGPGLTFVGYFKMREETRRILRQIAAEGDDPALSGNGKDDPEVDVQKSVANGVRLWEQYCREAPSDPSFQARFKLIPSGNLEEMGCPSYIAKYNGKPVLIKRNRVTGFFDDYRAQGMDVMEFDISLHPFPYLFKQAMAYLKDYFDKTVASFGFVIEGRNDEELPEVVIGAMQVCHIGPKFTVNGEDFFAGTCPKSSALPKTFSDDDNTN